MHPLEREESLCVFQVPFTFTNFVIHLAIRCVSDVKLCLLFRLRSFSGVRGEQVIGVSVLDLSGPSKPHPLLLFYCNDISRGCHPRIPRQSCVLPENAEPFPVIPQEPIDYILRSLTLHLFKTPCIWIHLQVPFQVDWLIQDVGSVQIEEMYIFSGPVVSGGGPYTGIDIVVCPERETRLEMIYHNMFGLEKRQRRHVCTNQSRCILDRPWQVKKRYTRVSPTVSITGRVVGVLTSTLKPTG